MTGTDTYDVTDYVPMGVASRIVGVHPDTLRRWENDGRIAVSRTPGGRRMFRVGDLHALIAPAAQAG